MLATMLFHQRRQAVGQLHRAHRRQRLHERRERIAAGLHQHRLQQARELRLGLVGVTRAGMLASPVGSCSSGSSSCACASASRVA